MKHNGLFFLGLYFVFASCTDYHYLPTKHNVLVFENKEDLILSANVSLYDGFGLEAGYAFNDFMGIYSSINRFNISSFGDSHRPDKDFLWDNELIFYKKMETGQYLSMNLGTGWGILSNGSPYIEKHLNRQFLLPAMGWVSTSGFECALSARLSRLLYTVYPLMSLDSEYDREMFENYFNLNESSNSVRYLVEPAMTIGYTVNYMKFKAQLAWIKNTPVNMIPCSASISVGLNLHKMLNAIREDRNRIRH